MSRYKRFLELSSKWPRNPILAKRDKDFGSALDKEIKSTFTHGETTQIEDVEKCEKMYNSLLRLQQNHYKLKYPRRKNIAFSDVPEEKITQAVNEFVKAAK